MKYDLINIKTVMNSENAYSGLAFFEGERDIPFAIKSFYCIYETQKSCHQQLHMQDVNQQLLFCPYGEIDIILDDGEQKEVITLDSPSKGLILFPGICGELKWKQDGAVLCVAASAER